MSDESRIFIGSVIPDKLGQKKNTASVGKIFQSALASTTSNLKKNNIDNPQKLRFTKLRGVTKVSRITATANKIRNQASPWAKVREYLSNSNHSSSLATKQKLEKRKQRFANKDPRLSEEKKQERANRFSDSKKTKIVTTTLQTLSTEERMQLRKLKFGSQEDAKKQQRQKRFSEHLSSSNSTSSNSVFTSDFQKLQNRKNRFNNEAKNREAAQTIFSFLGNSN